MKIYVVFVLPEANFGKVSQEGYSSLEKAQAFIENRSDKPEKLSDFRYCASDYSMEYIIYEVTVA